MSQGNMRNFPTEVDIGRCMRSVGVIVLYNDDSIPVENYKMNDLS